MKTTNLFLCFPFKEKINSESLCKFLINPLNSMKFVLNKLKKDKVNLKKDFYVFTGSTVDVVPKLSKGLYIGIIGSEKSIIKYDAKK